MFALQVTRHPNCVMAFGNVDIVLNTSHLSRKQNLVTHICGSYLPTTIRTALVAVSLRSVNRFYCNGGRNFHSNNQWMRKIHRTINGHGLGKTRFDQRPDEAGYQRRRQDGRPYRPRSDPILGRFVIGVKGGMFCQFLSAACE